MSETKQGIRLSECWEEPSGEFIGWRIELLASGETVDSLIVFADPGNLPGFRLHPDGRPFTARFGSSEAYRVICELHGKQPADAPDLLAALEEIERRVTQEADIAYGAGADGLAAALRETAQLATAAISKARGAA